LGSNRRRGLAGQVPCLPATRSPLPPGRRLSPSPPAATTHHIPAFHFYPTFLSLFLLLRLIWPVKKGYGRKRKRRKEKGTQCSCHGCKKPSGLSVSPLLPFTFHPSCNIPVSSFSTPICSGSHPHPLPPHAQTHVRALAACLARDSMVAVQRFVLHFL